MPVVSKLLIHKTESLTEPTDEKYRFFSLEEFSEFWNQEALAYSDYLDKLVFRISRKPKQLLAHLQRIYYCFHTDLNAQLFAAIVDLLFVLNKRGQALSWRVVMGCKSKLTNEQFETLKQFLKDDKADIYRMPVNQYSVLARGLAGSDRLVEQRKQPVQISIDPLELARDYIEYSQLDEAKSVLEKAILQQPERVELHHELLTLYRSTRDASGFNIMLNELLELKVELIDEWKQLNTYFKG